ncbi:MAG: single-stranded-DNA-specific exonuclease RecJ [Gammaproteobacteria bacterium]|nr:single-stranded-DNA-specific exonuclease RecJ [Gammaproteobacteria bacterium]
MHADSPLTIVEREGATPDLPGVPDLLRRIYGNRGITSAAELERSLAGLEDPAPMRDIDTAAQRIARAVREGQHILFVGDFDADGATSVALGVSVLQAFGAERVDFVVPNRFEFGYGLSPEIVRVALAREPDLLITVDNGVSSIEGVELANAGGVDVIVTDHHLPGARLPPAHAIVNPNVPGCGFPSKAIAGVGVIYCVLSRVRRVLGEAGWFAGNGREEPNLAQWLDLVALGTVADVVPLDRNNRTLVHQGLVRMRKGRCRHGIQALAEVSGRSLPGLRASDLGFQIGPRLNAAGRLKDMSLGIRCLLADSLAEARQHAAALDELNRTRRELQREMVAEAELIVAEQGRKTQERYGVSVFDPDWHQGIVGIVAGRLRERINRPVVAFAPAGGAEPEALRGSARSVPELHIRDALDALAARHPGLLVKFGGHAMAAGLSIRRVHYEHFAKAFDRIVQDRLPPAALEARIETDGELSSSEITLQNAVHLADGGPWGQAFPEPSFHGEFEIVNQRVVGETHLKLVLRSGARLVDAIAFNQPPLPGAARLHAVYRLDINDYGGAQTVQLRLEHVRQRD